MTSKLEIWLHDHLTTLPLGYHTTTFLTQITFIRLWVLLLNKEVGNTFLCILIDSQEELQFIVYHQIEG